MKQTINESEFIDAFRRYGRLKTDENSGNFTVEALRKLWWFYEELEASIDDKTELDVIAICCDWGEYENWDELIQDYGYVVERADYETEEEYREAVFEYIDENTYLMEIDKEDGWFVIQVFKMNPTNFDQRIDKDTALWLLENDALKPHIIIMCKEYGYGVPEWVGVDSEDVETLREKPEYKTFELWNPNEVD